MVPANVSMVGAGVMVPQVSTPMGMGTALTRESGGNVTRPVSSTVPVTAARALVSSKIETEPVMVSCAPACTTVEVHGAAQRHQHDALKRGGDRQRALIGARDIRNLRLR